MIFFPPGRKTVAVVERWPLAELRLKLSSSTSSSSYSSSSYGSLLLLSDKPIRCSAIHLPYPFSVVLYWLREIHDNLGYCKGYFALRDFQIVGVMFKYDDRKDVPYQVSESSQILIHLLLETFQTGSVITGRLFIRPITSYA